jgi:voltage-gated potassium channel
MEGKRSGVEWNGNLYMFVIINKMYLRIKRKIYLLLDPSEGGTYWDKVINTFIITLIILNTVAVMIETVESVVTSNQILLRNFESFSIAIFTIEYILRLWTCTEMEKYKNPLSGRLKYIFSFGALVDLLAITPFYAPVLIGYDLRFIRVLRLLRFFRFFKLGRYLNASKVLAKVFHDKKEELLLSLAITIFLIVIASSLMYYVEHDAQPEKFSSIPETMWWSVATLTTVGYGDIFPVTPMGKTLTAVISILGIGMFALPAGILASGFSDILKQNRKKRHCENCGHELQN